jgi:hypothetical protein
MQPGFWGHFSGRNMMWEMLYLKVQMNNVAVMNNDQQLYKVTFQDSCVR